VAADSTGGLDSGDWRISVREVHGQSPSMRYRKQSLTDVGDKDAKKLSVFKCKQKNWNSDCYFHKLVEKNNVIQFISHRVSKMKSVTSSSRLVLVALSTWVITLMSLRYRVRNNISSDVLNHTKLHVSSFRTQTDPKSNTTQQHRFDINSQTSTN